MANISPKLFQKAIQTGLKTALFTTSTAALMLTSSGALGAALYVTGDIAALQVGDATNLSAPWANADSLKLTGAFNINTGEDALDIAGVDIDGNANQLFTVAHDQITIGGVLDMNLTLTNAAGTVTVGSVGAGDVRVAGGVLGIGAAGQDMIITGGTVNQSAAIVGDLTVSNGGIYVGTAAANVGGEVDVQADAGAVTIHNATGNVTVAGSTLAINNADADMTITGGTVNQTGTVGGNLDVSGTGNFAGDDGVTDVTGTVNLQADAGTVTIRDALAAAPVTVAGGILNLDDAANDMTITGGQVNQTGDIGGNLAMSNGGVLNGTAGATNVGGTVLLNAGFAGQVTINNANGLVTTKGGTLTLNNAANGINFAVGAAAGTTVNVIPGGDAGDVDNTTGGNTIGTLTFKGVGTANNIGANNSLAVVSVDAGEVTITGAAIQADTINLTNGASVLTLTNANAVLTGAVDNDTGGDGVGVLNLNGALSQVTDNIGNANSLAEINVGAGAATLDGAVIKATTIKLTDNASALTFTNPVTVTGAIDNTGNTGNGIVTFTGNSTVTGNIGGTNALATVDVGAGVTLQAGGSLAANNIDFGAASILEFNGPAGKSCNLSGTIVNGANATLNVNTSGLVIANDKSIGTVAQINIQDNKNFAIDSKNDDVDILDAQAINFKGANSRIFLFNRSAADDRVITLKNDLPAFATGGGGLTLLATTKSITLQGDGGNKTIGTAGNELASLSVAGDVIFNNIDTTNVLVFNILGFTDFVDVGGITNQIKEINIGAAAPVLKIAAADGSYTIDTEGANAINILANGQTIKFAHEDATLVLQNSAAGNGTITLNAVLDPGAPNKGKLAVDSGAAGGKIILASANGGTYGTAVNRLKELEFRGNGTFQVDADIFANDLELSVPAITYNKDINSNLTFGANTALTQNGNINGNVDFNNKAAVITLGANKNITGSVTSSNGVNGTIIASGASTIKGPITNLAMLKVGAGAVNITQGGNTSITEIQGNGTALLTLPADFKLTGAINATGGQALKLNFTNGGSVSGIVGKVGNEVGNITTAGAMSFASSVNAKGTATFSGTTSFADTFTNTGAVTLAKDSINNFAEDVTATSFAADGATINFGNSLAFNSAITGSGTTLTLGANQITYPGTGSFTDTLILNTTFDGSTNAGGNILIKSGSTLDLSGVSTLNLVVTATNFDINNISPDTKYTVISAETAGGLKPTPAGNVKITVNNDNRFVDFTFDASTLTLFAEDIAGDVIDEDFEPGGPLANIPNAANVKKSLELMEQAPNGSDARQAFADWGNLTPIQEADAVTHLMQNVVKPSEVVAACSQAISGNILGNLTSINTRISTAQAAAVAAGDEDMDAKFGGWINPFVGNATQKKIQNISGYKSDTTGGTLGFDALINDDAVLGLAYTRAETDVKLKDAKSGDKNKVRSNIFSVYGLYNLPQSNFFVEGVASYGDSKVTSKSRRVISTGLETVGYQTANGKYKSENYTGQLMAGYNYALPETVSAMPLVVTPMAGVRYSDIKDKGYKETGTTYQNLLVKGKNYNTFDGLLGAKLSSNINVGEVVLTPELYAMVDYAFKNKAPAIDARLQGMAAPFPTNSFKPKKTSFDVGVGVTAKHKMMEYGINYDTNIGSKYFAQQGSVKVRVNF